MEHISLRFTGNGIAPATTRCKDLAAIITATENLLSALLEESESDQEPLPICLVEVENKSLGLKFSAAQMAMIFVIWHNVAAAINTNRYEQIGPKARGCLTEIVEFVKKRKCQAILGDAANSTLAKFDYTILLPENKILEGKSSLFGKVLRVGGIEPKVRLKLPSGKIVNCDTTEAVAKELGHRLYDLVMCKGNATWDFASGDVVKFRIATLGGFKKVSASQAFDGLARAMPYARKSFTLAAMEYDSERSVAKYARGEDHLSNTPQP